MFTSLFLVLLGGVMTLAGTIQFQQFVSHVSTDEYYSLAAHTIDSFEDLDNFFNNNTYTTNIGSYSEEKYSISAFNLEAEYPGYTFSMVESHETSEASGAIPLEMNEAPYPPSFFNDVIEEVPNMNASYAGCGPIAMVGIMDYFSRYLNYTTLISNVEDYDEKFDFTKSVFQRCHTYDLTFFNNGPAVFMTPWDYAYAFNSTMNVSHISNLIVAHDYWTMLGGRMDSYWDIITNSIDNGLPVTLMTTIVSGSGVFGGHYTNVYGYTIMEGVDLQNNSVTARFLKANINIADDYTLGVYCDARILNDPFIGLITYELPAADYTMIYASDTANVFVNSQGNGQYFFDTKQAYLNIDGYDHSTVRLRTSYIENQYLVMSPNRSGAGEAYLQIESLGRINFLRFHAGMWGYYEGIENETFFVEAVVPGIGYKTVTSFNLAQIGWKEHMTFHTVVLPYNTGIIRFRALHSNPIATTNKGRICLENIQFSYTGSNN